MHISEFWRLTLSDLDMENRIIRIDHQLQRTSAMEYVIESTQTNAGTRKIPMTEGGAHHLRVVGSFFYGKREGIMIGWR